MVKTLTFREVGDQRILAPGRIRKIRAQVGSDGDLAVSCAPLARLGGVQPTTQVRGHPSLRFVVSQAASPGSINKKKVW